MIVAAEPDIDISRVRHTEGEVLLASNLGDLNRDLRMGSRRGDEGKKNDKVEPFHGRGLLERFIEEHIDAQEQAAQAIWNKQALSACLCWAMQPLRLALARMADGRFSLTRRTKQNKRKWLRSRRSRPLFRNRECTAPGALRDLLGRRRERT